MTTTAETLSRIATRPTWAEVSLSALRQNFRTVRKHVGAGVTVCAAVKADAYGHGAVECSRALEAEGATWLAVTYTSTKFGSLGAISSRAFWSSAFRVSE